MKKINIAELLKDCPTGMELDCTMYDNVTLDRVDIDDTYSIKIATKSGFSTRLTKYGQNIDNKDAKCVIFPKGKTTWEGFVPPCTFKDGDVLTYMYYNKPTIYIYRENGCCNTSYYAGYSFDNERFYKTPNGGLSGDRTDLRLATEEEKEKLFKAIKDNGYRWNAETKTLDKLIEQKFKVKDRIRLKENHNYIHTITGIREEENKYACGVTFVLKFSEQDNWELVPNKFDITTLKPFDKVLARCSSLEKWRIQFFEKYDKTCKFPFICVGYNKYKQCIPYEGNEHLLDKTEDCDEYYKH